MSASIPAPDERQLRGLLDGTLSEAEQARVLGLVDAHPQWQQALDQLAAGAQTWTAAAEHLHEPPLVADAALRSAIAAVQPPTIASDQTTPEASAADLDFLDASDDPRYLGCFGQYLVEKVVGRGGFGIVLKAFDPQLRRIVALKVLAPHLASNATACARFNREALAAAAVVHDHVITIHVVGDQPLPHLVMQYVAGMSLQEKLDATGPLGIKEVLRIGMQTAAGLAAAHKQGQVHRDIKPANILLENGVERVKITDFGLARAADDASMTQSGTVAGTPQYMSPEQARGETVDFRSDLFSLGSVLYAMCAGRPPFRATTTMGVLKRVCEEPPRPIRESNPEIPDWLAAIIEKLMAKRPADRFASAHEVAELLGQCLSHVQQPAANLLPQCGALAPRVLESARDAASLGTVPPTAMDGQDGTRSVPATYSADEEALLDRARRAVREPAIGLIITGILNWIALAIVFAFLPGLFQGMMRNDDARWLIPVIAVLGLGSGLIVVGGLKLLRLESRFLVTLASVAALLIGPGYFVGFPIGLWALVMLQRREVKEAFSIIRRRRWPGLAGTPAEPIERYYAKEALASKPHVPAWPEPPTAPPRGNGIAILVLVLLVLFGLPAAICSGIALTGYRLLSSSGAPPRGADVELRRFLDSVATLIVDCPDSRFSVRIRRMVVSGDGDATATISAQNVTPNQPLTVVAGEYEVTVLSDGIEVMHDRLVVDSKDSPVVYKVKPGGTLRFLAGPGDRDLSLAFNHITGQTIWDWPNRQWFVLPEGVVHVELRRPTDDGSPWHILTANYFDIVAGQETVIRVRERDVELVSTGEGDPVIALEREVLSQVETRYASGIVSLQDVLNARLKLQQARVDWAEKAGRRAEAMSIRRNLVALAEEKVKAVEALYRNGNATLEAVNDAKGALLKEQEQLKESEAKAKAGSESRDSQPPPPTKEIMRESSATRTQTASSLPAALPRTSAAPSSNWRGPG